MRTVTKRDLNQRTAVVLAQVTETADVVVTERGTPRWRVSAVQGASSALARLEREGLYEPAAEAPTPWPSHPGGPAYTSAEADALLAEQRRDH
ncbi:hypothetical protein DRB06_12420 [Actinomyces sp. Z5]|uniref:hypothetical protein n=1 Tax=Actinomyces sp. Z5 TaxID=2250216 RepID=UPI000DCB9003|nr:hypothetical protein [Actinomyces sp. Z5]RAX19563.1 hypothetical protein DRB06_12420 [Actinomyces sp. Z5]